MRNWTCICLIFFAISQGIALESDDYGLKEGDSLEVLSRNGSDDQTLIIGDLALLGIHAQESETSVLVETNSNSNNSGQQSLSSHRCTEAMLKNLFRQYNGRFFRFLIRHRKADFLFPFHYFW